MKLSYRLGLAYGFLLVVVLTGIGFSLFVSVRSITATAVSEGLTDVARIAAHNVNLAVGARWELLDRNMRIVEQWERTITPRFGGTRGIDVLTDYPEQPTTMRHTVITGLEAGRSLSQSIWNLSDLTGAEIAVYQQVPEGIVIVDTTGPIGGERNAGYFLPVTAAPYQLITSGDRWIGRDYYDGRWYLVGYTRVPIENETVYLRIAVQQIDLDVLDRDLSQIQIGDGGSVYILDTSASVVLDRNPARVGVNLSVEPYARQMAFGRSGTVEYREDRDYLAAYEFVESMNWIVVVATTTELAYREIDVLARVFIAMFGIAVFLAFFVSMLLGRQISRPVAEVARRFKEIADGEDLSTALMLPSRGSTEVRALVRDFNRYVHRTLELNELERREIALELQQEQMKALRAQINPHFLYNTLETIRFLIEMGDARAIGTVQTLSDLFRISLAGNERLTTLRVELEHARLYFEIHAVRYSALLPLEVRIDENLLDTPMIGFLLQPLVENAVVHGIVPNNRPGTVTISSLIDGDDLLIMVADDGVGISGSDLETIRARLARVPSNDEGIGLRNVHERLRLTFGAGYGLSIESGVGDGTTVTMRMERRPGDE